MRSFIAIELPEKARSALADLQKEFRETGADVRWVRPENIHLTLKFLGSTDEKYTNDIINVIEGTCEKHTAFSIQISGAGVFPNTRSPRVLWAGLTVSETLTDIQREIDTGVAPFGFQPEKRRFVPHLTLGRFRSSRGKEALLDKLETYKTDEFGSIDVTAVSFIKSDLDPAGAKYTCIARVPLAGGRT